MMCPNCGVALSKFESFEFGNVEIAYNADIMFKGQPVGVSGHQRMIAEALIRVKGRPMDRYALLDVIGMEESGHRTIDVYIRRIRLAFEAIDPNFDQITTVRGLGYRWDFVAAAKANPLRLVA